MDTLDTLTAALAWCAHGCSVIRAAIDGSKAPLGTWKHRQQHRAAPEDLTEWFGSGHPGLGIVCGAVSGNLEMLEIEGRAVADGTVTRFLTALEDHGLTDVRDRILNGYLERSPSGGLHLFYTVNGPITGNTKLAQRPDPEPDNPHHVAALIETRGEGGYVIVAPSHGPVHPSGAPWEHLSGHPGGIPTLSPDERDAVHAVATLLDEMPTPEPLPDPVPLDTRSIGGGVPPGVDYNARATWSEILEPAAWTRVRVLSGRTYWRRPGKSVGISAVTGGPAGDYFWSWTTSTDLPAEQALSKWRVYTLLHHAGDFTASARALAARGYGTPAPPPQRPVLTLLNGSAQPESGPSSTTTTLARTEDAAALTLVDSHGHVIRHCRDTRTWLHWTGHVWTSDEGDVREYVKGIGRSLIDRDTADIRFKTHVLSAAGTTSILAQAASDPRIRVRMHDLDSRPFELNTPGGMVDLTTGTVQAHNPAHLHSKMTTVTPDPEADIIPWATFLAETFVGHPEMPRYIQQLVGYSATGAVREPVLPFCFGAGANGKTVFLETVAAVLGDYATSAPAGFLMARQYPSHDTELARLVGMRMVICSELNQGDKFDEARVKMLTGGDKITARFIRQDHFTFAPSHHLWLAGNHQPMVSAGGLSFWRRVRIVPFTNTVPPERQQSDLSAHLVDRHGPAILAWIISGAVDYFANGLDEPGSVHGATTAYAHDQDSVGQWLEDCCRIGGGHHVLLKTGLARGSYEAWCRAEGCEPVSAKRLTTILANDHGVSTHRTMSARFYAGLSLNDGSLDTGR